MKWLFFLFNSLIKFTNLTQIFIVNDILAQYTQHYIGYGGTVSREMERKIPHRTRKIVLLEDSIFTAV